MHKIFSILFFSIFYAFGAIAAEPPIKPVMSETQLIINTETYIKLSYVTFCIPVSTTEITPWILTTIDKGGSSGRIQGTSIVIGSCINGEPSNIQIK